MAKLSKPECMAKLQQAYEWYERGQFEAAQIIAEEVIESLPRLFEALQLLAILQAQQGQPERAIPYFEQALKISPARADLHFNLGIVLSDVGRWADAVKSYTRALQLQATHADACFNLGLAFKQLGRLEDAAQSYRKAIKLQPRVADAHYNLGNILQEQGLLDQAVGAYQHAIQIDAAYLPAHLSLARIFSDQGKLSDAAACYQKAVEISPQDAMLHLQLSNTLGDLDQPEQARQSLLRALELEPNNAKFHTNLGNMLKRLGQVEASQMHYRRAVQLEPHFALGHFNLANGLKDAGHIEESLTSFANAIAAQPGYVDAHCTLGSTLLSLGRVQEAKHHYQAALAIAPDYLPAHSNLLFLHGYLPESETEDLREQAQAYGDKVAASVSAPFTQWVAPRAPERLRVGVVSGDLRQHPVGYFLENLLSHTDANRIEWVAYPTVANTDALSERLKPYFSAWKPLLMANDEEAARFIQADGIHVLLDLSGHTAFNRLPVFAWKPAPVQASWLGYFGSTGVAAIDYLLVDPWIVPRDHAPHFTEKIWRLPETYLCFTRPPVQIDVASLPALRDEVVTFGCFNNLAKMTDEVVALWSRVLQAVPNSRLFLKAKQLADSTVQHATTERFARHGIAKERLLLEGPSSRDAYLAAYHRVDIALDPFPYPGGTTSVEGLWMGVPVITRAGTRLLSRNGAGIAHNVGLSDWVAQDDNDYIAKAQAYSADLTALARLRAGLRTQIENSPLMNGPQFAKNFAQAMWDMWHAYDR